MIHIENHMGTIEISAEYFANLIGDAVSSCYGVAGMVKSGARQGIRTLVSRRTYADQGVRVRSEGGRLVVELHIAVIYGMNIKAIAESIEHKVRFTVEQATGLVVKAVKVCVDGMRVE